LLDELLQHKSVMRRDDEASGTASSFPAAGKALRIVLAASAQPWLRLEAEIDTAAEYVATHFTEIQSGVDVPRAVAITPILGVAWRSSSDVVDPGPQQWPWAFDYQRRPGSRGIGDRPLASMAGSFTGERRSSASS
jgi:hypothetical protein